MRKIIPYLGLYFAKTYVKSSLFAWQTLSTYFSVLGVLWLILESLSFLSTAVREAVADNVTVFLALLMLSFVGTLIRRRPDVEIRERIGGMDSFIKIKIGNILDSDCSCIISTNTTFDTDTTNGIISKNSLQGQFTQKYYNSHTHLDADLQEKLRDVQDFTDLSDGKEREGKTRKYPLGTVVKLEVDERKIYLLAMADMNARGNAECDFSMISDSLNRLWQFLGEGGEYEKELLIPVLGTGPGRLPETREEIIQEIINSFIAASTQKRLCETLTIVIHSGDFYKFALKMEELRHYLSAQCRYSRIRKSPGGGGCIAT